MLLQGTDPCNGTARKGYECYLAPEIDLRSVEVARNEDYQIQT